MTGEEGGEGGGEGENCHPLITSLLNEGAVIKTDCFGTFPYYIVSIFSRLRNTFFLIYMYPNLSDGTICDIKEPLINYIYITCTYMNIHLKQFLNII